MILNPNEPPTKSSPCSAKVCVQKLDPSYTTQSKLYVKLDSKEHFWRLANQDKQKELDFTEVDFITIELDVICTATGIINMPLLSLCKVNEVTPGEDKGQTEVVIGFEPGEIEYLACGRIVQVLETVPIVTQV